MNNVGAGVSLRFFKGLRVFDKGWAMTGEGTSPLRMAQSKTTTVLPLKLPLLGLFK
jgi:hypothetical protein